MEEGKEGAREGGWEAMSNALTSLTLTLSEYSSSPPL